MFWWDVVWLGYVLETALSRIWFANKEKDIGSIGGIIVMEAFIKYRRAIGS